MSKVSKTLALLLSAILLNGCIASRFLGEGISESENSRWVATNKTDSIMAVGKPAKSIKGYENALVLVGEKHNYLIQSVPTDNELKRIFETLDLKHLTINLPKEKHIAVKQSGDANYCPSEYGCAWNIELRFKKELSLASDTEKDILKALRFSCYTYTKDALLSCYHNTHTIAFTMTQKSISSEKLNHRLNQPVPIVFYEYQPNKGSIGRAARYALLPVAIAFDIVTFPIQAEIVDIKK